jgi:16S rRNA (cytidine1402-2'-O)-methyltransferase
MSAPGRSQALIPEPFKGEGAPVSAAGRSRALMPDVRRGRLWLVPNTLDLGDAPVAIEQVLPQEALRQAAALTHWVVEEARSARAFLKRVAAVHPLAQPLQALDIRELPRPQKGARTSGIDPQAWIDLLAPARAGHDIGLLSEAGLPAVADPGAQLVAAAHAHGIEVWPLSGPSALLLALSASGLDGQQFAFVGYLPQEATARAARIRELEAASRRERQTQLCIETPYRNTALLQALVGTLAPATRLAVACGVTLPGGFVRSAPVAQWRAAQAGLPASLPDRMPAVFLWLA